MKVQTFSLIPVLAAGALARPRARPFDVGPVAQQSHVTAFIITDEGVKVECWSIGNLLPASTSRHSRKHGQVGPSVFPMLNDELQGVDILTWPDPQPFWPPPKGSAHDKGWDDTDYYSGDIYAVQGGLIDIRVPIPITAADDDDDDDDDDSEEDKQYIFAAENGDNWFYFEDQSTSGDSATCAHSKADTPPLTASTRSADGTTLIQFKYDETPTHEVLHPGRCRFTGLVSEESSSSRRRRFGYEL